MKKAKTDKLGDSLRGVAAANGALDGDGLYICGPSCRACDPSVAAGYDDHRYLHRDQTESCRCQRCGHHLLGSTTGCPGSSFDAGRREAGAEDSAASSSLEFAQTPATGKGKGKGSAAKRATPPRRRNATAESSGESARASSPPRSPSGVDRPAGSCDENGLYTCGPSCRACPKLQSLQEFQKECDDFEARWENPRADVVGSHRYRYNDMLHDGTKTDRCSLCQHHMMGPLTDCPGAAPERGRENGACALGRERESLTEEEI